MKIVVIGGSGRIGKRLVHRLRQQDHPVFGASPTSGVDALTGVGLAHALIDADVVVDCSNAPSIDGSAPVDFFRTAGRNLLTAEQRAGVRHHIVLSIVGLDHLLAGDYFRAKKIQEDLAKSAGIAFTIVRSTQFFEFISGVVQEGDAGEIAISPALVQPIAGGDVADFLANVALRQALDTTCEIAGPEQFRLDEVATEIATLYEDGRRVRTDPRARYFGAELQERSLLPGAEARLCPTRFDDWLSSTLQPARDAPLRRPMRA